MPSLKTPDKGEKNLNVGDTVIVYTILGGEREYPVLEIWGNKAITKFRTFNRIIYLGKYVYEYGKNKYSTTNSYWIKS
jgi:hypothetical protein